MAIETTAISQAIYGLPCHQTQRFLESIFELIKLILMVPYHRTL
ncbi:MAG: transposase [Acidobacteria bacterium]|nr:transposase [Acidobacteriota bacterium]